MRQFLASAVEVIEVAVMALLAVFLVRTFLVQPFLVNGASMAPNFEDGDYLLIDELSYYFREPARGEVVVFRYPRDESTYFIKRIIGLPGEQVEIKGGAVRLINGARPEGFVLEENYLPRGILTAARGGDAQFTLQAGEYLVLGDNRSYSFDSRDWGVLKRSEVVGMVRLRLWPVREFTVFAAPRY